MQRGLDNDSYRAPFKLYLNDCRGDVGTFETKDPNPRKTRLRF
ncbi:MAG: hypothetical protein WCK27_04380 [Verrucomicrobiota bacterium]